MTAAGSEAKTRPSKLIKKARSGEEVCVAAGRAKKPSAKLTPAQQLSNRRFGFLKHLNLNIPDSCFFDPLPEDELRLWDGEGE